MFASWSGGLNQLESHFSIHAIVSEDKLFKAAKTCQHWQKGLWRRLRCLSLHLWAWTLRKASWSYESKEASFTAAFTALRLSGRKPETQREHWKGFQLQLLKPHSQRPPFWIFWTFDKVCTVHLLLIILLQHAIVQVCQDIFYMLGALPAMKITKRHSSLPQFIPRTHGSKIFLVVCKTVLSIVSFIHLYAMALSSNRRNLKEASPRKSAPKAVLLGLLFGTNTSHMTYDTTGA